MPTRTNSNTNAPFSTEQLFSITTVVASMVAALVGFLAASILFLFQPPTNPDQPLVVPAEPPAQVVQTECSLATGDQLQTCCQSWATENQILTPQCVGEWTITSNACNWVCSLDR